MKITTFVFLQLLIVVPLLGSCPPESSTETCQQLEKLEAAFSDAVNDATLSLVKAVNTSSFKLGNLYRSVISFLATNARTQLKEASLDDNVILKVIEEVREEFQKANKFQSLLFENAVDAISSAQEDILAVLEDITLTEADRRRRSVEEEQLFGETYILKPIGRDVHLADVLSGVRQKIKKVVKKTLQKVDQGVTKVSGFLQTAMKKLAGSQVFKDIEKRVQEFIEKFENQEVDSTEKLIDSSLQKAVIDSADLSGKIQAESNVNKRGVSFIKSALKKIGAHILSKAKVVLAEKKPEIFAAVKNLGRVLVDTGKQLVAEVAKDLITGALLS